MRAHGVVTDQTAQLQQECVEDLGNVEKVVEGLAGSFDALVLQKTLGGGRRCSERI